MPAHHLTPMSLYNLGFRGYTIGGVECILPPICPVPGGVFVMGSDKAEDPQAFDAETPQYPVEVNSFSIGQHPVTVAEYACAVRAKAVREPTSEYLEPYWHWPTQLTRLSHPVVCVSWDDTIAYIRWLAKTTRQLWRLPSEAQWEKAARWDPERKVSRIYPWGDTFDKARCNTYEGGVKSTTLVGSYPPGISPCGAQDMAGNVWEWTSSLFAPYPYMRDDGREDPSSTGNRGRMQRGGSWYGSAENARPAFRLTYPSRGLNADIGFRLVLEVMP